MKRLFAICLGLLIGSALYAQDLNDKQFVLSKDVIKASFFHDNGKIAQAGAYNLDNKLHGKWVKYDKEGNVLAVAYYDAGQKVGTWSFYQGDIMKEVTYVDSRIAEVKTWKMEDSRIVSN